MPERSRVPVWFVALLAAAVALLWRAVEVKFSLPDAAGDAAPVSLAFGWGWILGIGQAIWTGIQAVGQVTLEILKWAVAKLWAFATMVYNGLRELGKDMLGAFKKVWGFTKEIYTDVLKPAWDKFFKFAKQVQDWLQQKFKPIFDLLFKWRKRLQDFYTKWVRPILDVIGITRKIIRVFELLNFKWARELDKKLAELERRIDEPFRRALTELNKVINVVNRVVTADGLFQRLALVRSVERDIREVSRAFVNWRSKPITEEEWEELRRMQRQRTPEQIRDDAAGTILRTHGPYLSLVAELSASARKNLEPR